MTRLLTTLLLSLCLLQATAEAKVIPQTEPAPQQPLQAEVAEAVKEATKSAQIQSSEYRVGVDDILDINVLQPDPFPNTLTVSPDGTVTFPYIGNVLVRGLTLIEVQEKIQNALAEYVKYPVVSVSLRESRSRTFYVYGEVVKPGAFQLQQGMTVLRAVSLAGGFTKYGSASKVKVLRQKKDGTGNQTIAVDLKKAMSGEAGQDMRVENGDVVTVEEGVF